MTAARQPRVNVARFPHVVVGALTPPWEPFQGRAELAAVVQSPEIGDRPSNLPVVTRTGPTLGQPLGHAITSPQRAILAELASSLETITGGRWATGPTPGNPRPRYNRPSSGQFWPGLK